MKIKEIDHIALLERLASSKHIGVEERVYHEQCEFDEPLSKNARIYFLLSGELSAFFEDERKHFYALSGFYIPPNALCALHFLSSVNRVLVIDIAGDWFNKIYADLPWALEEFSFVKGNIPWMCSRLYADLMCGKNHQALDLDQRVLLILREVALALKSYQERNPPEWLIDARFHLQDQFDESFSLKNLADVVGVHPVHLSKSFRKQYRYSISEFLTLLRVRHAARLLISTPLAIGEVAISTGFVDQSHLTNRFKVLTGLTPGDFRLSFPQN